MNGLLLIDKPAGPTSHDVVSYMRKVARMKRIGHTGTLDPAASGLLILCLGHATRLAEFITGADKTYEGTLRLGLVTDSYDMDGEVLEKNAVPQLSADDIQSLFDEFTGDFQQIPPMVSAVKINGERLYKLARKGETIERPARPITIHEFKLLNFDGTHADFLVRCSSGTYIRSLCHDIGKRLGCGGVLAGLRRTHIGKHSLKNAIPMEDLEDVEDVSKHLLSIDSALELPALTLNDDEIARVRNGISLDFPPDNEISYKENNWIQLKSASGELIALAQCDQYKKIRPRKVFK